MNFSHRTLILAAGTIWLAIGVMLLSIGLSLTTVGFLIALAIGVGYLKGRFVLAKAAAKQVVRITSLKAPLSLKHLYSKGYYILIACMMGLGMSLRFLPVPNSVRAFVDITVGIALIMGALQYYFLAVRVKAS